MWFHRGRFPWNRKLLVSLTEPSLKMPREPLASALSSLRLGYTPPLRSFIASFIGPDPARRIKYVWCRRSGQHCWHYKHRGAGRQKRAPLSTPLSRPTRLLDLSSWQLQMRSCDCSWRLVQLKISHLMLRPVQESHNAAQDCKTSLRNVKMIFRHGELVWIQVRKAQSRQRRYSGKSSLQLTGTSLSNCVPRLSVAEKS